jgi:hypothetical protein
MKVRHFNAVWMAWQLLYFVSIDVYVFNRWWYGVCLILQILQQSFRSVFIHSDGVLALLLTPLSTTKRVDEWFGCVQC